MQASKYSTTQSNTSKTLQHIWWNYTASMASTALPLSLVLPLSEHSSRQLESGCVLLPNSTAAQHSSTAAAQQHKATASFQQLVSNSYIFYHYFYYTYYLCLLSCYDTHTRCMFD
jgi:hypothetical protein